MCQLKVKLLQGEREELVAEDVSGLLVEGDGVVLTLLFEGPRRLSGVAVAGVDSLTSTVWLRASSPSGA